MFKTKQCESCKDIFDLSPKEHHVRWCKNCRPKEYAKITMENRHGIYKHKKQNTRFEKLYIKNCLDTIINKLKRREKYKHILDERKQNKPYSEIGNKFGISRQRVHQICSKYLNTKE